MAHIGILCFLKIKFGALFSLNDKVLMFLAFRLSEEAVILVPINPSEIFVFYSFKYI